MVLKNVLFELEIWHAICIQLFPHFNLASGECLQNLWHALSLHDTN